MDDLDVFPQLLSMMVIVTQKNEPSLIPIAVYFLRHTHAHIHTYTRIHTYTCTLRQLITRLSVEYAVTTKQSVRYMNL
jgi:hypothetical protein